MIFVGVSEARVHKIIIKAYLGLISARSSIPDMGRIDYIEKTYRG
jgi:hypothetical protein